MGATSVIIARYEEYMTMIWTLIWSCPDDAEYDFTLWRSEENALKQACDEISDLFQNIPTLFDAQEVADVLDLIAANKYREALDTYTKYNMYHVGNGEIDCAHYWSVEERPFCDDVDDVQSAGMHCAKCTNFYPYTTPNQTDGTFVCYGCRNP